MEQRKTIVSHLEELRKRLLIIIGCFVVFCSIPLFFPSPFDSYSARFIKYLFERFIASHEGGAMLVYNSPLDPLAAALKVSVSFGVVASAPVFLYQAYAFIAPAFRPRSRSLLAVGVFCSLLLLVAGVAVSWEFLMPKTFDILLRYGSASGAMPMINISGLTGMVFMICAAFALPFELPLVIGMLSKAGVLPVETLRKNRKFAVLFILLFSAFVTPDPTPVSMVILSACLILLYELGIIVAAFMGKPKKRTARRF